MKPNKKSMKSCCFAIVIFLVLTNLISCNNINLTTVNKRPVYIIGHMANDLELIKSFLNYGSNALEFDLKFTNKGEMIEFTHGFPCDLFIYCNRKTPVQQYLNYFATEEIIKKKCFLAVFDLKLRPVEGQYLKKAGGLFAEALQNYFYKNDNQMKILLSIPSFSRIDFLEGFVESPNSRNFIDKVSFGFSSEPKIIESMEKLNLRYKNIPKYYGGGTTSWINWYTPKLHLMIESNKLRDQKCTTNSMKNEKNLLNKVWYWTAGILRIKLISDHISIR